MNSENERLPIYYLQINNGHSLFLEFSRQERVHLPDLQISSFGIQTKEGGGINLPDLVLHFGLDPGSILLVTELTGALADGDTVSVVIQGLTLGAGAALSTAGQVLGTDRVVRDDVAGTHALIGTVLVHLTSLTWQL